MKTLPIFERKEAVQGELRDFNGWRLPNSFSTIEQEWAAANNSAAVMARPYLGLLQVSGKDHIDLLHRITTNDMRDLKTGEGQLNIFTNEKGRIVDRVFLYKFEESILLVTSPNNTEQVSAWIDKYVFIEDVKIEDLSDGLTTLSVFGPRSAPILESILEDSLDLPANHFKELSWQDGKLLLARTPELQIPGYNLVVDTAQLTSLWKQLLNLAQPVGEATYEVLRIEAGWPLLGKDFDDAINPHEARLLDYVDFDKGCYVGQEVVARLDTYDKVQKYLMGIIAEGNNEIEPDASLFTEDKKIGRVTSVAYSPNAKSTLALGYVRNKFANEKTEVLIESEAGRVAAHLVSLPFVEPKS